MIHMVSKHGHGLYFYLISGALIEELYALKGFSHGCYLPECKCLSLLQELDDVFQLSSGAAAILIKVGDTEAVDAMATPSTLASPTFSFFSFNKSSRCSSLRKATGRRTHQVVTMRMGEKPLEELYHVRVERKVSPDRLAELGVSRWSMWKTGKCNLAWDWQADQLVYIEEGEVRVVPHGSDRYMQFLAGDLVRYPKWFEADLWFNGPYQERYSFRAYGDDY